MLLNDLQQAKESFLSSIAIRNDLGQPGLMTEPMAGLIQTALLQHDTVLAMIEAEKIMSYLARGGTLEGTEEPLRVYYACYLALENTQDPRSHDMLRTAIQLLEAQSSKLRDEGSRKWFVENIPWRFALQKAAGRLKP